MRIQAQQILKRIAENAAASPISEVVGMWNGLTPRQILEDRWRRQVQFAYSRYQTAKEAVNEAREIRADAPSPDGVFALSHALRIEAAALAEYKRVLQMFTDLLIDGKIPREERTGRSSGTM